MEGMEYMGPSGLYGSVLYDGRIHYVECKRYDWSESEAATRRIQDSIVNLAMLLNAPKHPAFRDIGLRRDHRGWPEVHVSVQMAN